MNNLVDLIEENMAIEELVWYLEEKEQSKHSIIHCLRPLLLIYREDLLEDYPWMEIPSDWD